MTTPYEETVLGLSESIAKLGNFGLDDTLAKTFEGVESTFEKFNKNIGDFIAPLGSNP